MTKAAAAFRLDPTEPIYTVDGVPCVAVATAARALGISRQAAREAALRGDLAACRLNGRIMVPVKRLFAWTPNARRTAKGP